MDPYGFGKAWPVLQDKRSVMSFLVWLAAVLTSQFSLSYGDGGDDCFSPVVGGRAPLTCPVDLDLEYVILERS